MESFNARRRDELVEDELFYALREARSASKVSGAASIQSGHTRRLATSQPMGELFVLASFPAALRRPRSAGHAPTAATADTKLTFCQDHSGSISRQT